MTNNFDDMKEPAEEDFGDAAVVQDPFSPELAPAFTLITQMRIYDVLLGIYTHLDEDKATALMELHAQGKILGSPPSLDL